MANLNVTGNFSISSNFLRVNYTTDVQNITKMEITKDNTNFITAEEFTSSYAVFDVSTWDNGTYTCKLRITYTEAVPDPTPDPTPTPKPDPTPDPTVKIALYKISNMTVNKGQTFNILYSSNISAVKHEISWDGGNTFYDKTSEIVVSNTVNYKYAHNAETNYDSFNMAIRVTHRSGSTDTKYFTITFRNNATENVNNFTFTKNKRLNDGIVTDTEDGTFYTTVNKNSVTSGASYTISVNSANYMCICFYDSNDNYLGNNNGGFVEAHTDDWSVKALSTTFTIPSNASYLRVTAIGNGTQITGTLTNNGSSTPSTPSTPSGLLDSNGAYMVDDFTGSSLNRNKWDYEWGYVRNGELQNYQDSNAVVNNGILELQGRKDSNGTWTAASIISKGHFAFMYGKIECRAKIDPTWGSFSAFWTLGDSFEFGYHNWASPDTLGEWWAWCGEFDVMEFYSGKLTCGTFFNEKEESGRVWYNNYDFNAWHTFAMEWLEDGTLIFSIDGNELSRTNPTDNRAFHIPHFILINQAIGASGGTPADSTNAITQYVDWVKYYPPSTNNVVLNSNDFYLTAMDYNDNAHNCMVRPTFNDNCINKSLTWKSSNPSLVWVHSGLCGTYAGANGTVTITATTQEGVSRSITLTVTNGTLRSSSGSGGSSGGDTSPSDPDAVYDNPTYSVKDYKIILTQDGYKEVFDANDFIYVGRNQNKKEFTWTDGNNYALALYAEDTGSKFRINGMYPSADGYRELKKDSSDEPYDLLDDAFVPTVNNFNFSVGVRNGDLENQHQVDADLLNDCLYTLNCALPALNYHVDSNSANTILLDDYQESWFGLSMTVNNHFLTRLNKSTLTSEYGQLNSSNDSYKAWKSALVHELGHSLGFDDNAVHYPTLYTYRRNRARVNYLQAPDIFTLKSLYKEKYNIDISKSQEDINAQVAALGLGTSSQADMPNDKILSIRFDYPIFTSDELYDKSDLIIEGKLEFDRCESINIGSENNPLILKYNVYKIIPNSVIKGEITNYELKIHISEKVEIGANHTYKLYLKQFENIPCSLVNIEQGIQIKE